MYSQLTTKTTQSELLLDIVQQVPNDGIVALRELTDNRLLITKPSVLADLLVHRPYDFEKPANMRKFLGSLVGNGLITAEGDNHRFIKRNSQSTFGFRRIRDLYPMIWKHSLDFTEALKKSIGQQNINTNVGSDCLTGKTDIVSWASKVTLDIIGIAGLGYQFNALENSDDPLVANYKTIFSPSKEMLLYFVLSAWFSSRLVRMLPWKMNQIFRDTGRNLREGCLRLVRGKREAIQKNEDGHIDVVSLLIKSGHFSDESLCDQLLTLLAAG